MTRTRWWSVVVPIAAVIYAIVVIAAPDGHHVAAIGAMVLAIVVLAGLFFPVPTDGRQRNRKRRRTVG